jgi:hypothetical protein
MLATLHDLTVTSGDDFGCSVAVSGNAAPVGTYGANTYAGAAYDYVRGTSGWSKSQRRRCKAPGDRPPHFHVANNVNVGEPGHSRIARCSPPAPPRGRSRLGGYPLEMVHAEKIVTAMNAVRS